MISNNQQKNVAKSNLIKTLAEYDGDTKNPMVVTAIDSDLAPKLSITKR